MGATLYILKCADDSYYTGITRDALEIRLNAHNQGIYGGYTFNKRPVMLVFSPYFEEITDAIACERQIKGWSRAKKEAIIKGRFDLLAELASRPSARK
jgi:putative endonuclease